MSKRYEIDGAETDLALAEPGTWVGEHQLEPGQYSLIIGNPWSSAFAVVGTRDALLDFAQRVTNTVHRAER